MLRKLQSGRKAAGNENVTESCYPTDEILYTDTNTKADSCRVTYAASGANSETSSVTNLRFPLNHRLKAPHSQLLPTCAQQSQTFV